MADVTQTPANVHAYPGATGLFVTLGEACVAGDWVYLNPLDNKYYKGDNNNNSTTANCRGMLTQGGSADDTVSLSKGGPVDVGGTLTPGEFYVLSSNPGKMMPASDLASGHMVTLLGVAAAADQLNLILSPQGFTL